MTAATCPICGTIVDKRVGNRIAGVWRYCWLCPKCGERWGWINEQQAKERAEVWGQAWADYWMKTGKEY